MDAARAAEEEEQKQMAQLTEAMNAIKELKTERERVLARARAPTIEQRLASALAEIEYLDKENAEMIDELRKKEGPGACAGGGLHPKDEQVAGSHQGLGKLGPCV